MNGAPTALEAIKASPENFTDKDTVTAVQKAFLEKGYADGSQPDGEMGKVTQDTILSFRARNNLPLIPVIDSELLRALEVAPQKELPIRQVTATKAEIAPVVEVVAISDKVQRVAWWSKLYAWITGLPVGLITVLGLVVDNLDEATTAISPVRSFFSEIGGSVPVWVWLVGLVGIAILFGYQAKKIENLTAKLEAKAVTGYQQGTIKNDLPPKEDA